VDGAGWSRAGWFTTAPESDRPARFALAADIGEDPAYLGLLAELAAAAKGADLVLSLGDWPYADFGEPALDLASYRAKHYAHRTPPALRELTRHAAVHAVWDDHEVTNDWDGGATARSPDRVAAAMQAWLEWFPVTGAPPGEVYRRHRWGPNVEVFWLDARSHRAPNAASDGPAKSMLGEPQRAWLLESLAASTAAFKLVVTTVPLWGGTTGPDSWRGFAYERRALLGYLRANRIGGVVFLTADQHWLAVHHLPSGPLELQISALAQFPREPPARAPAWFVTQQTGLGYAMIDYLPGDPPRLELSAWGEGGRQLYAQTLLAGRGAIAVLPARQRQGWRLDGAHVFTGAGPEMLPVAPPGEYQITWLPAAPGAPATLGEVLWLDDDALITFAPPDGL
jgi:alkaline phosphatase D